MKTHKKMFSALVKGKILVHINGHLLFMDDCGELVLKHYWDQYNRFVKVDLQKNLTLFPKNWRILNEKS